MIKIVAVIGSPKGRGAGHKIVTMIEDRMKSLGDVEFEYLFLKEAYLKPCTGCYACMAQGEDKCPLADDRAAMEQKLFAADGVILSSPVYVGNVSGLMKNFIDRFAYTKHRPRFHRLKVLTVANMAGTEKKGALASLDNVLGGSRVVHELGIPTPPWPQSERAVAKKERAIDAAAKKFYRACLDGSPPAPTFNDYMNFFSYQKLSRECRRYLPADHSFYNGKTFYPDLNVHPIKAAAVKALVGFVMNMMKDLGPGGIAWPVAKE